MAKAKRKYRLTAKALVYSGLIGAVLSVLGYGQIHSENSAVQAVAIVLFLVPIALGIGFCVGFGAVAIHELGHWVAMRLLGFTPALVRIGRLRWRRVGGKMRFDESDYSWMRSLVSFASAPEREQRWRFITLMAAGSIASGLAGTLFALWALQVRGISTHGDRGLGIFAGVLGFCAVLNLFMVIELIPLTSHKQASDGFQIYGALTDWPAKLRHLAVSRMIRAWQECEPSDTWSANDIARLLSDNTDSTSYPAGLLCVHYRAVESNDIATARTVLEDCLTATSLQSIWFQSVRCQAAIFFGYYDRNATRAQDFLSTLVEESFLGIYSYGMAVACTRLAQGKLEEATSAATEALASAIDPEKPIRAYPVELEILKSIQAECVAAKGAANVESD